MSRRSDPRRRFSAFVAVSILGTPIAGAEVINVDHTARVHPVAQGNANLCWLAAAAMLMSWKRAKAISMADLAMEIGEPFASLHRDGRTNRAGGALPFYEVNRLAAKLSLKTQGLQSMTTAWWTNQIGKGPLIVGGFEPAGSMGHVVLLTGIQGDTANASSLVVRQIDPNDPRAQDRSFLSLIEFYENLAASAVANRIPQIVY